MNFVRTLMRMFYDSWIFDFGLIPQINLGVVSFFLQPYWSQWF